LLLIHIFGQIDVNIGGGIYDSLEIAFWTPGNRPVDDGNTFGFASHGSSTVSTWKDPGENAVAIWDMMPVREVLTGKYSEVFEELQELYLTFTITIGSTLNPLTKASTSATSILSFQRIS
jgi:hypothetical protein